MADSMTENILIRTFNECPFCIKSTLYEMNNCVVCSNCGFYAIHWPDGTVKNIHLPKFRIIERGF